MPDIFSADRSGVPMGGAAIPGGKNVLSAYQQARLEARDQGDVNMCPFCQDGGEALVAKRYCRHYIGFAKTLQKPITETEYEPVVRRRGRLVTQVPRVKLIYEYKLDEEGKPLIGKDGRKVPTDDGWEWGEAVLPKCKEGDVAVLVTTACGWNLYRDVPLVRDAIPPELRRHNHDALEAQPPEAASDDKPERQEPGKKLVTAGR